MCLPEKNSGLKGRKCERGAYTEIQSFPMSVYRETENKKLNTRVCFCTK